MLKELEAQQRMQLMKFVCSFAWADLQVHPHERAYVAKLVHRLDLDREERAQVDRWLEVPPHAHEVDPTSIPLEHRKTFVESIIGIIESDGIVTEEERESLGLFQHLLR